MDEYGRVPIYRGLYIRQTWGGVPRKLFIINLFICVFSFIILKTWVIPFIGIILHFLFKFFAMKDSDFFDIFLGNLTNKNFYKAE